MKPLICSECGTEINVKPASEYAELAHLLDAWESFAQPQEVLLCSHCAQRMSGEQKVELVKILPLDFLEVDDVVDET